MRKTRTKKSVVVGAFLLVIGVNGQIFETESGFSYNPTIMSRYAETAIEEYNAKIPTPRCLKDL